MVSVKLKAPKVIITRGLFLKANTVVLGQKNGKMVQFMKDNGNRINSMVLDITWWEIEVNSTQETTNITWRKGSVKWNRLTAGNTRVYGKEIWSMGLAFKRSLMVARSVQHGLKANFMGLASMKHHPKNVNMESGKKERKCQPWQISRYKNLRIIKKKLSSSLEPVILNGRWF